MADETRKPRPRKRSARSEGPPRGEPPTEEAPPEVPAADRELVVVAASETRLRASAEGVTSLTGADVGGLGDYLAAEGLTLEPLFGMSEDHLLANASMLASSGMSVPDLSVYYRVQAEDSRLDDLAMALAERPGVAAAYVKPPTEPATEVRARPDAEAIGVPATPDFSGNQGYLGPAPEGVNARWAHTQLGGRGAGVQIIDVEGAWQFAHEDLLVNQGGAIAGTPTTDLAWRNHGTAVIGEFGADHNGRGVDGISPDAHVRAASIFGGPGSSGAIRQAADHLNAGDLILIELHRPGPRFDFASRADQRGYIAMEWWPDDFDAIRYAVARGIIVVEAAGNGAEDIDDAIYGVRPAGFPASWQNPFDPANPSSEAVLVGAGAPPSGTHGRDHGPDRSRLDFSNFGARLDAQGWGREVTTSGGRAYNPGDLQGGTDETLWYTDTFSGTSSASPIVTGALACIQGILAARSLALLTPGQARSVLRATGSPQQDAPGRPATQRVGNRPDIRAAVTHLAPLPLQAGVATQYWDECLAYPPGSTASLWLYVDNAWRAHDNPSATTTDLVQRAFLGSDSAVRVWYQGATVVGIVVTGA